MKYQRKPLEVDAVKLTTACRLVDNENPAVELAFGDSGDYLVTLADGSQQIWNARRFETEMEPVPEKPAFSLHNGQHVTVTGGGYPVNQCRSVDAVSPVRGRESMSVPSWDATSRECVIAPHQGGGQ